MTVHEPAFARDPATASYYDQRAGEYDDWYESRGLFVKRDRPGWAAEVDQVRQFKAQVVKQLRVISLAYPQARVNVTGDGLMLGPSPLPVPRQTVLEL
jgi:hypothetical protein